MVKRDDGLAPHDAPAPAGQGAYQGTAADGLPLFYAPDRQVWRAWLDEHHAITRGVWLVYYKVGSGHPRIP